MASSAPFGATLAAVPQAEQVHIATLAQGSWGGHLRDRLMVPDTKLGWLPDAVRRGKQIIAERRPALLFSSSPPETAHLIANLLQRGSGLPWIADLRDGWLFEPPNAGVRQGRARQAIERRMEAATVARATALVTATEPIAADLRDRYPTHAAKVHSISNGFVESEFAGLKRQRQPDGAFRIVHTGSLSASRQGTAIAPFFEAVARVRAMRPAMPLTVRLIGNLSEAERRAAMAAGAEWVPPLPRRAAHQEQLDADALLLITAPGQRSVATLKLFEYIRAGVPILALATDNAAAAIVEQYGVGVTAAPDNPEAIARALMTLAERAGKPWPGFSAAQARFDRRTLTGELAALFERYLAAVP